MLYNWNLCNCLSTESRFYYPTRHSGRSCRSKVDVDEKLTLELIGSNAFCLFNGYSKVPSKVKKTKQKKFVPWSSTRNPSPKETDGSPPPHQLIYKTTNGL